MYNLSRLETFVNCGFKDDPFRNINFETGDSMCIQRILSMGIKSRAMISIVGERGAGKTRAVTNALNKLKARPVIVRSADKSKLLISDIEQAMILDLSDEKPKRGKEIRARQLRRILGGASIKNNIVVVIEEGHRLHNMTLRSLKTLREMDWMGETELFSIVLVGQSDPMTKPGVSEVRLRSDVIHLEGLANDEIRRYIQSTVGEIFSEAAINKIAELPEAKNFLNLQSMVVRLMGRMLSSGRENIGLETVIEEFESRQAIRDKRPARSQQKEARPETKPGNNAIKTMLKNRLTNNDVAMASNG